MVLGNHQNYFFDYDRALNLKARHVYMGVQFRLDGTASWSQFIVQRYLLKHLTFLCKV